MIDWSQYEVTSPSSNEPPSKWDKYAIPSNGDGIENSQKLLKRVIDKIGLYGNEAGAVASSAAWPFPQLIRESSRSEPKSIFSIIPAVRAFDYFKDASSGNLKDPLFDLPEAKTNVGKIVSKVAPFVPLGIGAFNLGKSIFSTRNLSKTIANTKGIISDIVHLGPSKVASRIDDLYKTFGENFGNTIKKIGGEATRKDFGDALKKTAKRLGATNVEGSEGNKILKMAEEIMKSKKGEPLVYGPEEIQAKTQVIMNDLKSNISKSEFYHHLMETISQSNKAPELAALKAEHAPLYKIAEKSKFLKSSFLNRVANNTVGGEELATGTEAQQMLGDEPNIVEQASNAGDQLRSQQNRLQKIIARQNALKNIVKWGTAGAAGYGGYRGMKGIFDLIFGSSHQSNQNFEEEPQQ